jgi:uncharacterized protein
MASNAQVAAMTDANPLTRHGALSYLRIPAVNLEQSATFYAQVFGWTLRGNANHPTFSDSSEQLMGAFVAGLKPSNPAGFLPFIYVQGLDATLARIEAHGGEIVTPPSPEGDLWLATFRDPGGNIVGLWEMGGR